MLDSDWLTTRVAEYSNLIGCGEPRVLDSDWLLRAEVVAETSRQCVKIWSQEPRVLPRRGGNVLSNGAESRKPTQCIKIGNVCIRKWSREPKADSMY